MGQRLQLLILIGDLNVFVCMHTRKICLKGRNMRRNLSPKTPEKAEVTGCRA